MGRQAEWIHNACKVDVAITGELMDKTTCAPDLPNESPQEIVRDSSGRFGKGHSGNAEGSKRRQKASVVEYCRRHSLRAAKIVMGIAEKTSASDADRTKAANHIIDRAHGRPEAAQSTAQGMFQGATIIVDTGIRRRALEPSTIDQTGRADGQDRDTPDKD